MNELREKIAKLKIELAKQPEIIKIKDLNKQIKENQELKDLINKYHSCNSFSLIKEIENNKLFQEYKESETDINILILKINEKLKKITQKGKCDL